MTRMATIFARTRQAAWCCTALAVGCTTTPQADVADFAFPNRNACATPGVAAVAGAPVVGTPVVGVAAAPAPPPEKKCCLANCKLLHPFRRDPAPAAAPAAVAVPAQPVIAGPTFATTPGGYGYPQQPTPVPIQPGQPIPAQPYQVQPLTPVPAQPQFIPGQ